MGALSDLNQGQVGKGASGTDMTLSHSNPARPRWLPTSQMRTNTELQNYPKVRISKTAGARWV